MQCMAYAIPKIIFFSTIDPIHWKSSETKWMLLAVLSVCMPSVNFKSFSTFDDFYTLKPSIWKTLSEKGKKLKFEQHNFDDNFVLDGVSLDLTDYRLWNYSIIRVTITQLNQSIILRIRTISFCFFASHFNRFFDSLLLLPFFTWLFHWAPK